MPSQSIPSHKRRTPQEDTAPAAERERACGEGSAGTGGAPTRLRGGVRKHVRTANTPAGRDRRRVAGCSYRNAMGKAARMTSRRKRKPPTSTPASPMTLTTMDVVEVSTRLAMNTG